MSRDRLESVVIQPNVELLRRRVIRLFKRQPRVNLPLGRRLAVDIHEPNPLLEYFGGLDNLNLVYPSHSYLSMQPTRI